MIARLIVWTVGFGLAAGGGVSLLAYLNYIPAGFSIPQYGAFILERLELYVLAIGLLLITGSIYWPEKYR
ncbi:hypothetical protein [Bacillus piscicola]|uniref:hypothetical protein n=1 Tax=Bacillus piscicola TaxID=1632684 RepID=UPI001F09B79C|nr:hypothetical protein [Bacillus piscicola]